MMHRKPPQKLLAGLFISLMLGGCAGKPDVPPNVLLVTLDTTRIDHLSCYGYDVETSPNLDRLAADGVRFERAYTTASLTPMAHASIFTGTNPYKHGLRVFYGLAGNFLSEENSTITTVLGENGYSTAAFVSAWTTSERYGLDLGFDRFESGLPEETLFDNPESRPASKGIWVDGPANEEQLRAEVPTDSALAWLNTAERPFFMWVHHFDPHDPQLIPPDTFGDEVGISVPRRGAVVELYDYEIRYMDAQVGRLIEALEENGEYENTIIVVVTDHGQGLGDHGWNQHRLLFEEQIRIALVVRAPGYGDGRVVPELVRNIDVFPTLVDLLDIPSPGIMEGRSLLPYMKGRDDLPRFAYAEALNTIDVHSPNALPEEWRDLLFCVADQDWKLIHHAEKPENSELYDLRNDPVESRNVAAEYPDQMVRLRAVLDSLGGMVIEENVDQEPLDPEARRKLEALGYLGD